MATATLASDVAVVAGCTELGDEQPDLLGLATDAVRRAGGRVIFDPSCSPITDQLRELEAASPGLVIAIGGDGTINAAAGVALRSDAPLLILPNGTMNLVAKDLHLPIDPAAILDAADRLTVLRIDAASVNGVLFLHSALIGIVPELARHRERIREADTIADTLGELPAMLRAAADAEELELRLEADRGTSERRTRSIAVSNNPLSSNGVLSHTRQSVAGGRLGVYASAHEGPLATLKLLASLGTGRLPRDPETLSTCCRTLTIHAAQPTVSISLDGEVRELAPPLRFEVHTAALRVAIPTALIGTAES